ncbi:MAG: hypothetical protein K2J75_06360, partial [Clostridia bacterium]|nr:hypothetical protein [Clostridia bacterium]
MDNTAVTITPNASDGLGEFNNGYSYVYTDKDLIDNYRAGNPNTPYDISTVKVDTSQARGTQKNPYVISSVADWENFVKQIANDNNKGSGKYFVLANDIDFDNQMFYSVVEFRGNFYGLGHILKNINCSQWQYWDGTSFVDISTTGVSADSFGVFGKLQNATITDLIVENAIYSNFPVTNAKFVTGHGPFAGGIAGASNGEDYILNCHFEGNMRSATVYSNHVRVGGILGMQSGSLTHLKIYRCSAEVSYQLSTNTSVTNASPGFGGIMGQVYISTSGIATTYVYDCVANVTAEGAGSYLHGGVVISCASGTGPTVYFENIFGNIDITTGASCAAGAIGSMPLKAQNVIKNCYVGGLYGTVGNKSAMYAAVGNGTFNTVSNINLLKTTSSYTSIYGAYADMLKDSPNLKIHSASSDIINAAKADVGNNLYADIWDADKIGGSYDPDNSPVRNYLMAFIDFRNLNNSGNSEEKVGLDDGEPYVVGDKLPDETSDV